MDKPWRGLPKETRDWILFTEEQPVVPVYPGFDRDQVQRAIQRKLEPNYMGKRLEKGRFVWPPIVDVSVTLTPGQLALLVEGTQEYLLWRV